MSRRSLGDVPGFPNGPGADRRLRRAGSRTPRFGDIEPDGARVPPTEPGQVARIEVPMCALCLPGDCITYFYMAHADGRLCFPDRCPDGVYVRILVREPLSL